MQIVHEALLNCWSRSIGFVTVSSYNSFSIFTHASSLCIFWVPLHNDAMHEGYAVGCTQYWPYGHGHIHNLFHNRHQLQVASGSPKWTACIWLWYNFINISNANINHGQNADFRNYIIRILRHQSAAYTVSKISVIYSRGIGIGIGIGVLYVYTGRTLIKLQYVIYTDELQ